MTADSRKVGKSEAITLPPLTVVVPGQAPQDGSDNPTTRQSDNKKNDKPRAKLAAPLLLLAVVTVAAGGVLAVRAWGWWGLAAAAVAGVIIVALIAVGWRRAAKRRRAAKSASTGSSGRTRHGIPVAGGGRRRGLLGVGRGRSGGTSGRGSGLLGRLTGRSGGAGRGRGGVLSRLAGRSGGGGQGRGGRFGSSAGRGRSSSRGRPGSVLGRGRGPRLGRGGALLSTGTGPSLGGRGGSKLFGGRRGSSRRTPGLGRRHRSGGHMLVAPSLPSLDATKKALHNADKAIGRAAGASWFATADAVADAVDTIKPTMGIWPWTHQKEDDMKSKFEEIAEEIPGTANTDPVTQHDLGLEAVIEGLIRGLPYIAEYIDKYRERVEVENYAGTEPITIEVFDAVARSVRSCSGVSEELLKMLHASPSWQDMKQRMETPKAARSDVGLAQRMGLL